MVQPQCLKIVQAKIVRDKIVRDKIIKLEIVGSKIIWTKIIQNKIFLFEFKKSKYKLEEKDKNENIYYFIDCI